MEATVAAVLVAVVAAIPPTLVAALAYRQTVRNAVKAAETSKKIDEVHVLTNSSLSTATAALALANEKIVGMEKLITEMAERPRRSQNKKRRSTRT